MRERINLAKANTENSYRPNDTTEISFATCFASEIRQAYASHNRITPDEEHPKEQSTCLKLQRTHKIRLLKLGGTFYLTELLIEGSEAAEIYEELSGNAGRSHTDLLLIASGRRQYRDEWGRGQARKPRCLF